MVLLTIALVITAVSTWLFVRGVVRLVRPPPPPAGAATPGATRSMLRGRSGSSCHATVWPCRRPHPSLEWRSSGRVATPNAISVTFGTLHLTASRRG